MNIRIRSSLIALSIAAVALTVCAAENKPPPQPQKKPMRVLAPPAREVRPMWRDGERRENVEMETVAFLGVETVPVSITTGVQLGLPRGTGLVVNHIVPKSAVDGVLKEHDILLQLDDQILIETRQLSVLIRNHKEGDEITLTYLRGGQRSTAKVKLGSTNVPKTTNLFGPDGSPAYPGSRYFELFKGPPGPGEERAEVDRVLSMIKRGPSGDPVRIQIDRNRGPGFRAMTLHTDNSNIAYSDDEGSLELTNNDGVKTLVAKNAGGEELFSGGVTTPEERGAMPAALRARLEKLEAMHDVTFRTDGDFKGAERRMIRPRGIALPLPQPMPVPPGPPAFY